jgi:pimeloyl-ACP methyl ester carboxylesterase
VQNEGSASARGAHAVRAFTIDVPEVELVDLRKRLAATRWPDRPQGAGWEYGSDFDILRPLVDFWGGGFDWRSQERYLNSFPQFIADIDGLGVHFLHERSEAEDSIPLLALHGWPSTWTQMLRIARPLAHPTDAGAIAFDVVAASLPGYGFSQVSDRRGMNAERMADIFVELMVDVLGYDTFAARCSDFGAVVVGQIARKYPERLIGVHCTGTIPVVRSVPADLTSAEQTYIADLAVYGRTELGYASVHSNKPHTVAVALNDSPAGLASWILEKFQGWTDTRVRTFEDVIGRDELLTNLTIYWVTRTIGASMRLYWESARQPGVRGYSAVPHAMLMAPGDFVLAPREWVQRTCNVVRWNVLDRGGHFLEWEEPQAVIADLRAFFADIR